MLLITKGRPGLTARLHEVNPLPSSRIVSECGMVARDDIESIVLRTK
jgi:hypothetical protein